MWEKDKENVREWVHTFTYTVTSLFLGRKGVVSGNSYLLAEILAQAHLRDVRSWFRPHLCLVVIILWDAYL